jgi:hypothetical protein
MELNYIKIVKELNDELQDTNLESLNEAAELLYESPIEIHSMGERHYIDFFNLYIWDSDDYVVVLADEDITDDLIANAEQSFKDYLKHKINKILFLLKEIKTF